ncbi:MAG: hypothetical protein DRJ51_04915 [Thermoprotei archaeon]|nr:MAG: hypothetical protein DRJ51_04915 [Thermoprotei archaeon]RLE81171.1 MAG: hypothetical protein DRJ36_01580 [Thermoprotei archaeon]RLF02889.1 MAG: hypothetical protein DRJ59_02265 [Thermoprotei archaeon]
MTKTSCLRGIVLIDDILSARGRRLGLLPAHGLSILLERNGIRVLFNTGPSLKLLKYNMSKAGVEMNDIDYVFISDWKSYHSGALDGMLEICEVKEVFAPPITRSLTLLKPQKTESISFIGSHSPQRLFEGFYTTGILWKQWYAEHALVFKLSDDKIAIFLGCSAYGFEHFIEKARELGRIKYIVGGLHLSARNTLGLFALRRLLEEEGVEGVIPLHCTSLEARKKIIKWRGILEDVGGGVEFALY